jgi:arsenate reductase
LAKKAAGVRARRVAATQAWEPEMSISRILFLCTGNSARSQMAEAFLRKYGEGRFEAHSAGLEPKGMSPFTRRVMEEGGVSLEGQRSKNVSEYMGKMHFGHLITVCSNAEEKCPTVFPGVGERAHWPIDDPAKAQGSEEEILQAYRRERDEVERRVRAWLSVQVTSGDRA